MNQYILKQKLLLLIFFFIVGGAAFSQTKIQVDSAINYEGKLVTTCTKVFGAKVFDNVNLLNLGAKYPNSPLTIAILQKDISNFPSPPDVLYNGKNICVTGTIEIYKGKPEIKISKPTQIEILKKDEDESR